MPVIRAGHTDGEAVAEVHRRAPQALQEQLDDVVATAKLCASIGPWQAAMVLQPTMRLFCSVLARSQQ